MRYQKKQDKNLKDLEEVIEMMSPDEMLKKLESAPKIIKIEGIDVTVYGLTFPELAHITPHVERKNNEYVLNYVIKRTLMKSFKDWTEKDVDKFIEKVNPKYMIQIFNAVKELSMPEGDETKNSKAPEVEL